MTEASQAPDERQVLIPSSDFMIEGLLSLPKAYKRYSLMLISYFLIGPFLIHRLF